MQKTVVQQGLHQQRNAASLEQIFGDIAAARLQIRDIGRALEHFCDIEEIERDPAFVSDRRQVERGIGRAAGGGYHRGGVLQCLAGDDVARTQVEADEVHHLLAGDHAEPVAEFVRRRRAGRVRQRKADRLGHRRHGVGGELRTAGAGRRTGDLLQRLEIVVRHLADRMLADRLEHVLHGDRLALEGAGQDRPAIDEDRRHVETAHRHHHARQRLVAAGEPDQRVIAVAAHRQLDGIGDHLARRQRRLHAFVTHGDAVGHGDGAEFARRAARRGDALLHRLRLAHQRDVARRCFVPAGGDADEGLMDLLASSAPSHSNRSDAAPVRGPR